MIIQVSGAVNDAAQGSLKYKIETKASDQYYPVTLFIIAYKKPPTFEFVHQLQKYYSLDLCNVLCSGAV